jgi:hypothetical protein
VVKHSELPYAPAARFQPGKVKAFINKLLKDKLGDMIEYDFEAAPALCRELADLVKNEIRGWSVTYSLLVCSSYPNNQNW